MKITKDHYKLLETAVEEVIKAHNLSYDIYQKKGLSGTRYRWDLARVSKPNGELFCHFASKNLYSYLNDNHIDTALRKITGTN